MLAGMRTVCVSFVLLMFVTGAVAQNAAWHVSKSSGDVWVTHSGAAPVSLTDETTFNPGDKIRTGQNGRALLLRGEESIMVSPNSVIGIPKDQRDGMSTTIIQQAGTILLDVEKRNVKHFEVETPYLAAVVKGTRFRVSVDKFDGQVDVLRGQVEVTDLKSGRYAMVAPGQAAKVSAQGTSGLSLSGPGTLSPIQQGTPRTPSATLVPVTEAGLSAPEGQPIRTASRLGDIGSGSAMPGTNPAMKAEWASDRAMQSKESGGIKGWLSQVDDMTLVLSVPFGVGVVVSVGVAATRRRQKQKQDKA